MDGTAATTSYVTDIEPLVNAYCANCHVNGNSGGFTFTYLNLAGYSSQVPSMLLIDPGSPNDSYIWHKLNGTQGTVGGSGSQMPLGGSLTATELSLIETWILEGAQP